MKHYDIEELAALDRDEIETRTAAASQRINERITRIQDEERDMTDREKDLSYDDRGELSALRDAVNLKDRRVLVEQRNGEIRDAFANAVDQAAGSRAEVETRQRLAAFDDNLRRGVPQRIAVGVEDLEVYNRSATTALVGATTEVSARSGRPPFIWSVFSIPFFRASSNKVEGPTWSALVSQTATAEGGTKPTMADATLDAQTLGAYAVQHNVSDQVARFGVGQSAVGDRLAAEAVFSVNGGIIDRWETHGSEIAFVTDAPTSLDTAIAEVVSRTGGATGIVLNASDYPAVAARSATSAGDVESGTIAGYNGLRLLMHPSMAAGSAVVVNGAWCSAHATDVLMASLPVINDNTIDVRAEVYAAVLIGDTSAVQRVAVAA